MKEDVKKLWVEALRSGEYSQGYGQLKLVGPEGSVKHCCLGVLCEVAVKQGVISESFDTNEGVEETLHHVHGFGEVDDRSGVTKGAVPETGQLPAEVMEWAGLDHGNPVVKVSSDPTFVLGRKTISLAELNDGGRNDFSKIADHIERDL